MLAKRQEHHETSKEVLTKPLISKLGVFVNKILQYIFLRYIFGSLLISIYTSNI